MITNDNSFINFRHKVIEEVCRLAWDKKLNKNTTEELVYELTKDNKPKFRCCIYKEREVLRQRINLAMGEKQDNKNDDQIVQVIDAACMECPISSYSVTDNCRFCIGRPCLSACKFDAISKGEIRMHIDSKKCKECGKCAEVCPFNAIIHLERPCKRACSVNAITYDEDGICVISKEKCIDCGSCIHSCPFGAISSKTYLVQIIDKILNGYEVYAMCAPATEGQFGENVSLDDLRDAVKKLGFKDLIDVGFGGDIVAYYESKEWSECMKSGKKLTTSCCPSFKTMLKKHFNEQYKNNVSNVVSPMCAVSRYLKNKHKNCITVFIGPCVAKKAEALDKTILNNADYAMTYGEFTTLLRSKNITIESNSKYSQESSIYGKKFAMSGGVAGAVIECMKERGEDVSKVEYVKASNGKECMSSLSLLKANKLKEQFIEGMVCDGGCVGGPSKRKLLKEILSAREKLLDKADNRSIIENLKNYDLENISMFVDK